ncbi:hypothetical protein JHK82_012331 [Glycine max]|nr:hypothetical protein JHK85_012689 [Glycine max]KAG5057352.1 hypothetical protein JHK86_012348 [Glycine max]KAG5154362.1 hypothetical protein JHK82_012331 [Glycine max]
MVMMKENIIEVRLGRSQMSMVEGEFQGTWGVKRRQREVAAAASSGDDNHHQQLPQQEVGENSSISTTKRSSRLRGVNRWMKETQKSTPVVVTMENPTFSVVEINGVDAAFRPVEKTRSKNAKQVTWFLFLKAYHAIGCVTWFATVLWSLMGAKRKRLIDREGVTLESEKMEKGKVLFTVIKVFLVSSLVVLVFEVVAYLQGWHFGNPSLHIPRAADLEGLMHLVYVAWLRFRGEYIAPPMQALSKFCIVLFLIQSVDRMVLCFGCFWIKYKRIKPKIDGDALKVDDIEGSACSHPMVLVQIPMCNEREV